MAKTPNAISKLRKFYKARFLPFDGKGFIRVLDGESDRAVILLVSSALDDMMTFKIANKIQPRPTASDFDHIFRFEGPMGTFSSKIEIATHFGVIDEVIADQLTDIREMRNACAHYRSDISFKTLELANVAKRIFHPKGLFTLQDDSPASIRKMFILECSIITLMLGPEAINREEAFKRLAKAAGFGQQTPPSDQSK